MELSGEKKTEISNRITGIYAAFKAYNTYLIDNYDLGKPTIGKGKLLNQDIELEAIKVRQAFGSLEEYLLH